MTKIKRFAAMGICALMIAAATVLPASANNHDDTSFKFFEYNSSSGQTDRRVKEDDSSMYMKPIMLSASYDAYAVGANSKTSTVTPCDNGYVFRIGTQGREYFINNWVCEWGFTYGAIHGDRVSGGGTVSGVWSPDSV